MPDPSGLHFASIKPFLDWHESQPRRYELVKGEPMMMQAGANRGHERIAKNAVRELDRQIDPTLFDVNKSDFAVNVGAEDDGQPIIRYPDVVVDEQTGNDKDRIAVNPVLVVEVLSRSTEKVDVAVKPQEYGSIPSLRMYVVFDSDKPLAQVWQRDELGNWPVRPRRIKTGEIPVPGMNATLAMDAVYLAVSFEPSQHEAKRSGD
jgi:Uma2 family endonuclease